MNHWLSRNHLVQFARSLKSMISGTMKRYISTFIWIDFLETRILSRTKFSIWMSFKLLIWFLIFLISLTDQIEPSGTDSTSGSIDQIFSALTYFEPNFMMILAIIRFDQPCRQENDFLIFHFNMKNQKNFNYGWTIQ